MLFELYSVVQRDSMPKKRKLERRLSVLLPSKLEKKLLKLQKLLEKLKSSNLVSNQNVHQLFSGWVSGSR